MILFCVDKDFFGHVTECHDWLLTGVELGNRKAACRERLLRVLSGSSNTGSSTHFLVVIVTLRDYF